MQPLLVVRRSMWSILWTFIWTIALGVLIIPIFYLIYKIVLIRKNRDEIYDDRVISYRGIFNISKTEHMMSNVLGVNCRKTFFGNMLNYGDVSVNLIGKQGLSFIGISNVKEVEEFFRKRIVNSSSVKQAIYE